MKQILLTLLFLLANVHASENIKLMTEIFPPYQFKNEKNELVGVTVEIVEAIQNELGTKYKIVVYPWSRALKFTKKKKNHAVFSMLRTPERENNYKWVGPIEKLEMVFFKRKGSQLDIHSLEDAKKVAKIGVPKNVANHKMLLKEGFTNLDVSASGGDDIVMKKLIRGRVDLVPTLRSAALYNLKKQGDAGKAVPIDSFKIFEGDFYIAFNKKTDNAIIKRWQQAFDKLLKNGTIEKIKKRY
ncbi:transporter substrate-binding domain-containing protein [Sulfurimonas sp. SAG-AH-194-I05]|nr:transporter substrate-binding domain-containing protein [Sulfurimonas sp. SAG-AH-194-I05]MDF1874526.1 transporter substrate-binding domain-containing protein [Sulfurimonas sp. SAG-AH-194-I05]